MGTRVILEAKAPEDSQEVEYISDSSEPESPLIKQCAGMETESPLTLHARRWIRMMPSFRGSSRSTSYHRLTDPKIRILMGNQTASLELHPRRRRATLCAVGLLPTSAVSDLFVAGGDHHAQYYLSTSSLRRKTSS
jgi:hypothetical protein